MSGWHPSRPPWETQEQPLYTPDDAWYGRARGPRVIIKPHAGSARGGRYAEPQRHANRGMILAGVVTGLAASVGIAAGAVYLTHVSWGQAPAPATQALATQATTAPATTPTPTPAPSASKSGASTTGTAYELGTPATAGGYKLTTPMSPAIQSVGSSGATALMTAVKAAGGKPAGNVSGEYFISGDQAIGYSGYNGTFSPAAVITAFEAGASGATKESAGPHGGELACAEVTAKTAGGASVPGTACVWATATTVGMVEFFGGASLETVPHAKAASDTLGFRDGVETVKGGSASATPTSTATASRVTGMAGVRRVIRKLT